MNDDECLPLLRRLWGLEAQNRRANLQADAAKASLAVKAKLTDILSRKQQAQRQQRRRQAVTPGEVPSVAAVASTDQMR